MTWMGGRRMKTSERLRLRTPVMPEAMRITLNKYYGGKDDVFCRCGNEWFMREEVPGDPFWDSPGSVHYHCTRCDLFWSSTGEWFQSYPRGTDYRWAKGFVWRPGMEAAV